MKKHIFITGRVQGVGFRHFTKKMARALDVKGWVKNLTDGRVEAVFYGDEDSVQELIERCKEGPSSAYVKEIEVNDKKDDSTFSSFEVRL